ncbi:hypothetical protein FJR48_04440 [Sulfurimonas lithotrophica]|uniref:Uncharacterized protein n=1 Tax=Sulfurimonas lithotrophica TaxID=2590022 RepID=A0A5P8P080_9BACT|nr:hypothetical protein [Sulfurimonas lithotrophica]QFR49011.1 hypothetical protein FJR48_04440 [Sulfurimonas lithotrophica]
MLIEEDYEKLKLSFIDSQRLFDKLNRVADQAEELEYDESGMYAEEEETLQRHWLKLSAKIVDALSDALNEYTIELKDMISLESRELNLNLIKAENVSEIKVDYSEDGAISISQVS